MLWIALVFRCFSLRQDRSLTDLVEPEQAPRTSRKWNDTLPFSAPDR